jgi:putative glutamine amidotransferase
MRKPVIGLDCSSVHRDGADAPALSLTTHFTSGVERAGGAPFVIPSRIEIETLDSLLPHLDGLLLTGGGDIPPEKWGGENHNPLLRPLSDNRAEIALHLTQKAIEHKIPVLGICLGCQVINVALGGTIMMDIHSLPHPRRVKHKYNFSPDFTEHSADVAPDSMLCEIMGGTNQMINSCHHQAIDQPGRGLRVCATAPDGIIEAVESKNGEFLLGVQWHPEYLLDHEEHFALFRALVDATK